MEIQEPRSNLQKILQAGIFAVTSELGPPKSAETAVVHKKAGLLRGVSDAANITDNQTAIVRRVLSVKEQHQVVCIKESEWQVAWVVIR